MIGSRDGLGTGQGWMQPEAVAGKHAFCPIDGVTTPNSAGTAINLAINPLLPRTDQQAQVLQATLDLLADIRIYP